MEKYFSNSAKETEKIAENFSKSLKPGDIVAFFGGLGAGKTAFTRGLAKGLHSTSEISSPTFALVHEYNGDIPIYHFDMYRVETMEDLYTTGYFDYIESGGITLIEWSENIEAVLDKKTIIIEIAKTGENSREITIKRNEEY